MITLEQLSAYLPYKLKGIFTDLPNGREFELTQILINTGNPDYDDNIDVTGIPGAHGGHTSDISNFKPILCPLSELTKGDWIELAKLDGWYDSADECEVCHYGIKQGRYCMIFNLDGFHMSILRQPARVTNQWQLWQYLLKHHYNVFNLPEGEYVRKG